jgi:murein DD-endopeptidase MepM/ murein hydrolase activator NlpD
MSALRLASGLSLLGLLAACTATPQYPVDEGVRPGAGVEPIRPRYPIDSDRRESRPPPAPRNARPAPPPKVERDAKVERDSGPRAAPSGSVTSGPLAGSGGRQRGAPAPATGVAAARPPVLAAPSRITVRAGESVFDIAERYRTPVRALIEANTLQPPYTLTPGMSLTIPPPLIYQVQSGDTLFGIARRFNIDPRSLANLNDIAMETELGQGRQIALPSLARDQGSNPQASGPSPQGTTLGRAGAEVSRTPTPPRPPQDASVRGSGPAPAVTGAADAQMIAAGKGRFIAPLRGEVLSGFGVKGPGQRNDGVNIAAAEGTPVKAAAAGEVVYAGSAIPGFGNLVLVKHTGGWVTAYAHLDAIAVKMRSTVAQGDKVGGVGRSGGVDPPQLHFEIRYPPAPEASAKPVDPSLLLPGLK